MKENKIDSQLRAAVRQSLDSGWSMLALSESAGVPRSSIREWYYDGKSLKIETAYHLAEWFGMRMTKPRIPKRTNTKGET